MQRIKQLTQEQKRKLIFDRILLTPELSSRSIAKSIGVSHITVEKIRKDMLNSGYSVQAADIKSQAETNILFHPYIKQNLDILTNISERSLRALRADGVITKMQETGSKSPTYCQALLAKERISARKSAAVELAKNDFRLFEADIRNNIPEVADKSVSAIICDAPYPKAYLGLYEALSLVAKRVLAPNGLLICMCGTCWLPQVMNLLGTHLSYVWQCVYLQPNASPNLQFKRVFSKYKPVLIYSREPYKGDFFGDVIKPPADTGGDKAYHHWGQSIQGMEDIIRQFTDPGQLIWDPFLGAGSTALATIRCGGRRFIGSDIDPKCIEITHLRVTEMLNERASNNESGE